MNRKTTCEISKLSFQVAEEAHALLAAQLGVPKITKEMIEATDKRLSEMWYSKVDSEKSPLDQDIDYGCYSDSEYPFITHVCFKGWSRGNTVNAVKFFKNIGYNPSSFLDVFGGNGGTSVILAASFPESKILFHNSNDAQIDLMKRLAKKFGVKNIQVTKELKPAECVLAFEALEHVSTPIEFIMPILTHKTAKFYVDASSFSIDSPGHFPKFVHGDKVIPREQMKRYLARQLNLNGYYQSFNSKHFVHKRFFNGRPLVFVREGAVPYK